ncbi:MAG: glycosyltransferase family 39 protein, partial [Cyanobacteria bacterium NC_groundwater_1444_Ag_S-0.65um_54_12]|nr:glycosyltransferase family 39 protein [Cyanobacteria bacterium NC_groundwater_1444_Ag_S-0.65um_54_12]
MNDALPAPAPEPPTAGEATTADLATRPDDQQASSDHPLRHWALARKDRMHGREWFGNWLTVALLLRLVLLALPVGFFIDLNSFQAWSLHLAAKGPAHFYETIWSDYPPGYLYILWPLGLLYQGINWIAASVANLLQAPVPQLGGILIFLMKLPGVLADILNSWLIYRILESRVSRRSARLAALFYAFNPVTIFVSAIWGQMDAVLLAFLLTAVLFMLRQQLAAAISMTALAIMIKPQGLFLVPAVFATQWFRQPVRKWVTGILAGIVIGWLLTLPFTLLSAKYPGLLGPVTFLWEKMVATAKTYPHSSVNAFNLWAPTGMWKPDSRLFLGIPHRYVGLGLMVLLNGVIVWTAWRR